MIFLISYNNNNFFVGAKQPPKFVVDIIVTKQHDNTFMRLDKHLVKCLSNLMKVLSCCFVTHLGDIMMGNSAIATSRCCPSGCAFWSGCPQHHLS
jgi:hypothetical protein